MSKRAREEPPTNSNLAESKNAKKARQVNFSAVTAEDLGKLGVVRKRLAFNPTVMKDLADQLEPDHEPILANLYTRIQKIYEHINTQNETGSRMITEAILLAAAETMSNKTTGRNTVIIPEMAIAPVSIVNPFSGYELCLNGNVNYVAVEHLSNTGLDNQERLLDPYISGEDIFELSKSILFVTQARRTHHLATYIFEAVSQSIAWMNSVEGFGVDPEDVYFCVTNGKEWIFGAAKSISDQVVYTESTVQRLTIEELRYSDKPLRKIVQLLREWMRKSAIQNLYTLEYDEDDFA